MQHPKSESSSHPSTKSPIFPQKRPNLSANRMSPPSTSAAAENVVTISTQLLVAAVIFLFMVVVFIFFLYLYARHYLRSSPAMLRRRRSRAASRFVFFGPEEARRGLDPQALKSLPLAVFDPSNFEGELECAVCLSEISQGEEFRLLPNCGHGFHVACIDMWFHSHSTCPLCRGPVVGEPEAAAAEAAAEAREESPSMIFPTNVLFWGNNELVNNGEGAPSSSSSSISRKRPEGALAIDIPRRAVEGFASPLASRSPMEETKTPKSARLRALRRLLSRGKMVIGCSPKGGGDDIEQGEGSSLDSR